MSRISQLSSPSPVLAVVRKPADIDDGSFTVGPGLYLALDSIRDPGNLGTILRIADWFGIRSVLASRDTVEAFNPKVVQATMGAIFRVDFHYVDIEAFASAVLKQNGKVYGTFLDGVDMYSRELDPGLSKPVAIVIGNEGKGISRLVREKCDVIVSLPLKGKINSLNASVAAGILMYKIAEHRE